MSRFYVFGSCMEYMFNLHCEAESEEEAFPNENRNNLCPRVYPRVPERELYRYESGGYKYLD